MPFPADTESRIGEFTELVGIAIANAEARTEIAASRARVVAAADQTRRRIERDLHDGAQQRLVSLMLRLRGLAAAVPPSFHQVQDELAEIGSGLEDVLDELREISGASIRQSCRGGLAPPSRRWRPFGRSVELDLSVDQRLPDPVEVAAYYVVSEALTNAAKHADASLARVVIDTRHWCPPALDSRRRRRWRRSCTRFGLIGLKDRSGGRRGTFRIESPTGVLERRCSSTCRCSATDPSLNHRTRAVCARDVATPLRGHADRDPRSMEEGTT